MNVATFPPASLATQLAELRRERKQRTGVYEHLIANRKLDRRTAEHRNNGLDGAIKTLERLVDAEVRGEPSRRELVDTLRAIVAAWPDDGPAIAKARALLERVPE